MKRILVYTSLCLVSHYWCVAQTRVSGRVVSADNNEPLPGASVKLKGSGVGLSTDSAGKFTIEVTESQTLVISYIGYLEKLLSGPFRNSGQLVIRLEPDSKNLKEVVVSTGYQDLARERSTGSYSKIDQALFESRPSTDVLSRLENLTSSLNFDRRSGPYLSSRMSIRGRSTILSDNEPLIVVDNFPYDGDLRNLNPNDVESVTVLKDAAAAAIWGARAGNGVIVINTKRGREGGAKVEIRSNVSIESRPDLFYDKNFLPSADFIDVEKMLFSSGFYSADEKSAAKTVLSPAVEVMIAERDGLITPAEAESRLAVFRQQDVREDFDRYVYRNPVTQQHAVAISGGGSQYQYYFSGGYDQHLEEVDRKRSNRLSLTSFNTFKPTRNLEIGAGLSFNRFGRETHSINYGGVLPGGSRSALYPYAKLRDENGTNLPIVRDYRSIYAEGAESGGLLNWQFVPLDEIGFVNSPTSVSDLRINTSIKYRLLSSLSVEGRYQYLSALDDIKTIQSKDTYFVRNMVNQFTQPTGKMPVPYGDIMNRSRETTISHSGRLQLNFNRAWNSLHQLSAIAGAEVRQSHDVSDRFRYYGFDSETLTIQPVDMTTLFNLNPSRTGRIPQYDNAGDLMDRYVSEYANASYSYGSRYLFTASGRRDASNLFGVKTNQKAVPLWSAGAGWTLSNESFYRIGWLPYLKMRLSYGYNGNINKSATAFSTASYTTDSMTGLQKATVLTPPDPQLRWEKVAIYNTGIDFELKNRRLAGSLEFYMKKGTDQIGTIPLDPTTGFILGGRYSTTKNGASIKGSGFDVELTSRNTGGALQWHTTLLFSYTRDQVTSYEFQAPVNSYLVSGLPLEGRPVNSLYAYRWGGLDPQTGDPMAYIGGVARKDYNAMVLAQTVKDIDWQGTILPPFFGAVGNSISWKGLSASLNINYKFGHVFRRKSIDYSSLFSMWKGHEDFRQRWQQPGDEKVTNIPSMPSGLVFNRDGFYSFSDILVEKGDHVRLQNLHLRYTPNISRNQFPLKDFSLTLYMENLGILWRANKAGIDPDYSLASILPGRTISLGFKATL